MNGDYDYERDESLIALEFDAETYRRLKRKYRERLDDLDDYAYRRKRESEPEPDPYPQWCQPKYEPEPVPSLEKIFHDAEYLSNRFIDIEKYAFVLTIDNVNVKTWINGNPQNGKGICFIPGKKHVFVHWPLIDLETTYKDEKLTFKITAPCKEQERNGTVHILKT